MDFPCYSDFTMNYVNVPKYHCKHEITRLKTLVLTLLTVFQVILQALTVCRYTSSPDRGEEKQAAENVQ